MFDDLLRSVKRRLGRVPTAWSIGLVTGSSVDDLMTSEPLLMPGFEPVQDLQLIADPFFLVKEGVVYIFFEAITRIGIKGEIHLVTLQQDGMEYVGPVLVEDFHLSFPYVFSDASTGHYHMIPESSEVEEIRLYTAPDPIGPWSLERVLLSGDRFVDTVAFRRHGSWYLVTEVSGGTHDRRRVYSGPSLDADWKQITDLQMDPSKCRMGGRLVEIAEDAPDVAPIVLLTQDCSEIYGRSVSMEQIGSLPDIGIAAAWAGLSREIFTADSSRWYHTKVHNLDVRLRGSRLLGVMDGRGRPTRFKRLSLDEIGSFVRAASDYEGKDLP